MICAVDVRDVMALEGLCGVNSRMRVSSFKRDQKCDSEVEYYSRNFINNFELAVPPYGNVSTKLCQNFCCIERCKIMLIRMEYWPKA
jgi:hypothetical protein